MSRGRREKLITTNTYFKMNYFKTLRITFIGTILLVTKATGSDKDIQVPVMNPISHRFDGLLDSLVKVNIQRLDTLKKLFKLYDVNGAKQILRTSQDEKDNLKAVVFHNQDELVSKRIGSDRNRLCFCQDTHSKNNEAFHNFKQLDLSRESRDSGANLRFFNNEPATESEEVLFLSIGSKEIMNERDNSLSSESKSSQDELLSKPLKSRKLLSHRSKLCISPQNGYDDCKIACREAYDHACAKYYCSESLYKQLRKDCRHACRISFKEPYEEDYD